MKTILLLLLFSWTGFRTAAFTAPSILIKLSTHCNEQHYRAQQLLCSTANADKETSTTAATTIDIDPKEAVKLFGRLAEKYIALDSSGGDCCYSACTDCEYRLPGGGYIMADQSSARPKWIPAYEQRNSNNREHVTVWSSQLFTDYGQPAVTKDEFVERLVALDYAPPLGGPYVGASAATIDDTTTAEHLFDVISEGKDKKLTKYKMSVRLKQLADGEEGLTWPAFSRAMGLS